MLDLIFAYLVWIGPFVAVLLGLGIAMPFLGMVTKPASWLVAFIVLFLCLVPFGGGGLAGASEGSLFRQIGWSSAFLISFYYAVRSQGRFTIPYRWVPVPYLVLLAYALLSVTWAEQPQVSAKRAVQLLGVLFIALALIRHRKDSSAFTLISTPGLIYLLLGVLAIASPSLSIDPEGNYKGFTFTKNVWGQFALLMALVFMFQALNRNNPRLYWGLFVFASASLVATRSATTIMIYVIAVMVVFFWLASKRYGRKLLFVGLVMSAIGAVPVFGYFVAQGGLPIDALFVSGLDFVGKDATLTGRTNLWRMMGYEIARHPRFGAGYGGFWLGLEGPSLTIVRLLSWRPGQAHNGYIDVTNELGYVGLILLLSMLFVHLRNIYLLNRRGDELVAIFHLAILVSTLLLNVSETSLMRTTHLWWIVLSISILEVHARLASGASNAIPSAIQPERARKLGT